MSGLRGGSYSVLNHWLYHPVKHQPPSHNCLIRHAWWLNPLLLDAFHTSTGTLRFNFRRKPHYKEFWFSWIQWKKIVTSITLERSAVLAVEFAYPPMLTTLSSNWGLKQHGWGRGGKAEAVTRTANNTTKNMVCLHVNCTIGYCVSTWYSLFTGVTCSFPTLSLVVAYINEYVVRRLGCN